MHLCIYPRCLYAKKKHDYTKQQHLIYIIDSSIYIMDFEVEEIDAGYKEQEQDVTDIYLEML